MSTSSLSGDRAAVGLGLAATAILLGLRLAGHGPGLIEVLLAFGPLVVVPLGRPLARSCGLPSLADGEAPSSTTTAIAAIVLIGALALPAGPGAVLLSLPWLAVTLGLAGRAAVGLHRATGGLHRATDGLHRAMDRSLARTERPAALTLAAIAVAWLPLAALHVTMSRADITYGGIQAPLVELAGVHFTFAGFGATTLVACLVAATEGRRRQAALLAAGALVGGCVLVGVGHLTARPVELAGTVAITVAVITIGALSWNRAPRRSPARILLRVSGLAVLAPMAFALAYAWALTTGSVHLPYETIAAIHGSLNAVGFVTCGMLGWRLRARRPSPVLRARSGRPGDV